MSESNQQQDTLLHGTYRILRTIGQGGFGRTFLAEDTSAANRPRCVIKQFFATNNSDQAAELFRLEAQRLKELGNHPQIPKLLEYFEEAENQDNVGNQYIAQEFIDGQNLEEELSDDGVFTEAEIRCLLSDLLPVLQFVHQHQVIHRDIKPSNIIRRGDRQLFLVDFGAAKFASETVLAKTGTSIGSAEYVAPEQAMGKAVFQSDLYSLGVTCIHLLTQIPPFDLMDYGEGRWVWRDYLRQPVSEELGSILDKLLQRGTKRRYQSAAEVLADLASTPLTQLTVSSPTRIIPALPNIWRSPLVRTVVAGVGSALVFSMFWVTIAPFSEPTHTPPITVLIPQKQKPQVDKMPGMKPDLNPRFPEPQTTESSKDQVKAVIPLVKRIAQIISLLLVFMGFGATLQKIRNGEDYQEAMSVAVMGAMATITMHLMLNWAIPDIEQATTTTPIETTSQLSPSLEKSPSSSLNQQESPAVDADQIPLEWLMVSGLTLGGISAFLIYKQVAKIW